MLVPALHKQSVLNGARERPLAPPTLNGRSNLDCRTVRPVQPAPKGKIVLFGILFFYPLAGVTYQFLHYLLGLKRLGYDPYYIEDSSRWVYDHLSLDTSPDPSRNLSAIVPLLEKHGFADRWAFRGNYSGGKCFGLTDHQIRTLYHEADAFLNVTGAQELRDEHLAFPRRLYVESDPFSTQARAAEGDGASLSLLGGHDTHFSFGENIGAADCNVPVGDTAWHHTRQPVAIDLWQGADEREGDGYRTITTWHNNVKNIVYKGETYYWTKDREFEAYLDLPSRRPVNLELATTVPTSVHDRLTAKGWRITNAVHVSQDVDRYKDYIRNSRAEFTVARDQYVRPKTGWFSDRSACFLAAGRPVITQETGFSKFLPTGKGLFAFQNMTDVLTAIDEIESDYKRNSRAARDIAAEYFSAEKVVGSLMERAGL
jgi:hypothetical protein